MVDSYATYEILLHLHALRKAVKAKVFILSVIHMPVLTRTANHFIIIYIYYYTTYILL